MKLPYSRGVRGIIGVLSLTARAARRLRTRELLQAAGLKVSPAKTGKKPRPVAEKPAS